MISKREKEILKMLYLPNKVIAQRLNLSIYTVKTYVNNLLTKYPMALNRTGLIIYGLKSGIIKIDDLAKEIVED